MVVPDPLKPDLTPIWRDRPRTVQPATRVLRPTDDPLQHDARLFHVHHPACGFVNNLADSFVDLHDTAAVRCHLLWIEAKASILAVLMDGLLDLRLHFDAHVFPR